MHEIHFVLFLFGYEPGTPTPTPYPVPAGLPLPKMPPQEMTGQPVAKQEGALAAVEGEELTPGAGGLGGDGAEEFQLETPRHPGAMPHSRSVIRVNFVTQCIPFEGWDMAQNAWVGMVLSIHSSVSDFSPASCGTGDFCFRFFF